MLVPVVHKYSSLFYPSCPLLPHLPPCAGDLLAAAGVDPFAARVAELAELLGMGGDPAALWELLALEVCEGAGGVHRQNGRAPDQS